MNRRSFIRSLAAAVVLPFAPLLEAAKSPRLRIHPDVAPALKDRKSGQMREGEIVRLDSTHDPDVTFGGIRQLTRSGHGIGYKISDEQGLDWIYSQMPALENGWRRSLQRVFLGVPDANGLIHLSWMVFDEEQIRRDVPLWGKYVSVELAT